MNKLNTNGFAVAEVIIIVSVVAVIAGIGVFVLKNNSDTDNSSSATTLSTDKDDSIESDANKQEAADDTYPEGWVPYTYKSSNVQFYHPKDWDASRINVITTPVNTKLTGKNFGDLYSINLLYKRSENKWLQYFEIDQEKEVVESEYTKFTKTPVNDLPAIYGQEGEGDGYSYYVAFTTTENSYLIEFPLVGVDEYPDGLNKQRDAVLPLIKTIKL